MSGKILCSAGRGEMTKQECLECALAQNNTCGYDYSLLNTMYNDKERTGIHVTDLTGCIRKAYYDKTDDQPEFVHSTLVRFLGTAVHKFIEGQESEHYENERTMEALGLVGTADVVYKDGRLLDFKTARGLKPSNLPYGSHEKQLNIYAALLRESGVEVNSAQIQYIDMSGPTKCGRCKGPISPNAMGMMSCARCGRELPDAHTGAIMVDVELEDQSEITEWIKTRLKTLQIALDGSISPEAEPSYLCDYCQFKGKCEND